MAVVRMADDGIVFDGDTIGFFRVVGDLSHVQDLLPTLADMAGVGGLPAKLDGQSLLPIVGGADTESDVERRAANKSPRAHIDLTAQVEGGKLRIEVRDDGRGMESFEEDVSGPHQLHAGVVHVHVR